MYGLLAEQDWEGLRAVLHPDVSWHLPGRNPISGVHKGFDTVVALLAAILNSGAKVENVHVGALDDGTVVDFHENTAIVDGVTFHFRVSSTYQVAAGRIVSSQVYTADPETMNDFWWARYQLRPLPGRLADGQL